MKADELAERLAVLGAEARELASWMLPCGGSALDVVALTDFADEVERIGRRITMSLKHVKDGFSPPKSTF